MRCVGVLYFVNGSGGGRSAHAGVATDSPMVSARSKWLTRASPLSAVDLAHHYVDAPHDSRDVGDQATLAQLVRDTQVAEATRPRPHAQRHVLLRRPPDNVEAHLPSRALRFDVALADAELSRRLDAMRVLRFQEFGHLGGRRPLRLAGHFGVELRLHPQTYPP